jgi:hypothetical protein
MQEFVQKGPLRGVLNHIKETPGIQRTGNPKEALPPLSLLLLGITKLLRSVQV